MASITQYTGSRYVPVFADPAEWNSTRTYEPLTIVLNEGNSYTSRQFVPVGVKLTNTDYWLETGNYNAQVEAYRKEVINYNDNLDSIFDVTNGIVTPQQFGAQGNGTNDDTTALQNAITYAAANKKTLLLYGSYLITKQISIPRYLYMHGNKYTTIISTCADFTFIAPYGAFDIGDFTFNGNYFIKISTSEYRAYNFQLSNIVAESCVTFLNMQYGTTYSWLYNCRVSAKSNSTAPLVVLGGGFSQYEGSTSERRTQTNFIYMNKCSFSGQFSETVAQLIEIYGAQWFVFNECDFNDCDKAIHITKNPLEITTSIWDIYFNNSTFFRCANAFVCERDFTNIQFNSSSFMSSNNAAIVTPPNLGQNFKMTNCFMQGTFSSKPLQFSNISNLKYDVGTQINDAASLVKLSNCNIIEYQNISQQLTHDAMSTRVGNHFNTMPIPYPDVKTVAGKMTGALHVTSYYGSYNVWVTASSDDYIGKVY